MTALEQVNRYIRQLETRLRLLAASQGFALTAGLALVLTVIFAWIGNRYQFAGNVVLPLRILLLAAIACAVAFAFSIPILKLTRRRVTHLAERQIPGFQERLLTATERPDPANPFTELVAEDVLRVAREHPPEALGSARKTWGLAAAGAITAVLLGWLITAGPGYIGYGASLLWTGSARASQRPLYELAVQPGNKTIRRKSDQLIKAQLIGFSAGKVVLRARSGVAQKWEEAVMQPGTAGDDYHFLLPSVSDTLEYYVQADGARSRHFKISVKDLPAVRRVRVLLHFPSGLGLKDVSDESGGDVRAVEGSRAEISVLTDKPLEHGLLVLDDGQKIKLDRGEGNWLGAEIPVKKDGSYHVAAVDSGETIRLSDDYFIEAKKDELPTVRIERPGHDPRVSPIEEVPISVEASDDFGVKALEFHYSVNGGDERVTGFHSAGGKDEQGHTTLYLENFKLAPGDVVSMYATASDANKTVRSDIIFAQAEAFEYKFSQSQQAGGMGGNGGGGPDNKISERQKQIIAATFNELRDDSKSKAALQEQAHFLSDTESKLGAQAKTLAERMGNRELSQASAEFQNFSKLMTSASDDMTNAVGQLTPGKWHEALVPEQKALQSLLRAEAIFRDIQVAFGQQQNGGGGSGGADRELARMFDLELDTAKNQYETGQRPGADAAAQQQKALDDAFQRLQMLARRQQELAQQKSSQQPAEQRWQEEQLRREAEELRRQMEQLAKNSQGGQQQQGASQGQQQSASAQGSPQSGSQSASGQSFGRQNSSGQAGQQDQQNREAMRQASNALAQAEGEMRKAVTNGDPAAQQRAAGQLAQAQRQLSSALHKNAGNSLGDLTQQADSIAGAQRDLANRMKQMYGRSGFRSRDGSEASSMLGGDGGGGEMPEMNDPDNQRFGYGYRRRNWMQDLRPSHRATEDENALAADKEKLAQQLDQLQRGMQQQAQGLQQTSPDASNKLRRALSEAEGKELALRMQKNAQWIREGYGDRNLGMEDNVTAGVEQLSRDLHGASQALSNDPGDGKGAGSEATAKALDQVRQLRDKLERAQASSQSGKQSGNGRQAGQPGGSTPGSAAGGQPQQGGTGNGSAQGTLSANGAGGNLNRRDLQQAIGQLSALRGQISGQDRALGNYLGGTLGYLRDLNADPGVLQATIGQDTVASLERLEAELSRRLGEQQTEGARSGASETSSEKYRAAVAEYFKKLSQPAPH